MTTAPGILNALQQFSPISLSAIEQAGLFDRVEVKYLVPEAFLQLFLPALALHYRALEIDGQRMFNYTTNYFDTAGFQLYRDHHNGYVNRMKVRQRRYELTGHCYFEIKHKVRDIRTTKSRTAITSLSNELTAAQAAGISYPHLRGAPLQLMLCNRFRRITLCNTACTERITIDTGITMHTEGRGVSIDGVALIEVKQAAPDRYTPAMRLLRTSALHSAPFSKYAIGASLLYLHLKHNNFKPILNNLRKYGSQ